MMARRPVLLALAALFSLGVLSAVGRAAPDPPRWRVGPSDFVHYRVVEQELEDSDPRPGVPLARAADLQGFYGWEVVDGMRVARRLNQPEWLVLPYVFRLPEKLRLGRKPIEIDEVVAGTRKLAAVRARGRFAVHKEARDARELELGGLVMFTPEPDPDRQAYRYLQRGHLRWTSTFDLDRGVITRVKYDLVFKTSRQRLRRPLGVSTLSDREREYHAQTVLELDRVYTHRYPRFQGDVDRAILRGCDWLAEQQLPCGAFRGHPRFGASAIALLTLVRSGRPVTDPVVKKGFDWLLAQEIQGTYETGMAAMAVEALGTPPEEMVRARRGELGEPLPRRLSPRAREFLQRCADYLMENALTGEKDNRPVTGRRKPLRWGYPFDYHTNLEPDEPEWWDNSNSQYAVLGLNSAARCGIDVPHYVWVGIADHYLSVQAPAGRARRKLRLTPHGRREAKPGRRYAPPAVPARERGWSYRVHHSGGRPYGSMTAAGISSLAIARARLAGRRGPGFLGALRSEIDQAILDGWAAFDRMWSVFDSPGYAGWHLYYLYGLERAGILSDVEWVEGHDWYWEGAMQILRRLRPDGSYPTESRPVIDTSWAILFLARSTTPITPSAHDRRPP